jgi:Protein phosphatase 2C
MNTSPSPPAALSPLEPERSSLLSERGARSRTSELFALAAGSVAGRHHARAGRNNQDAFASFQTEAGLTAVVRDGCSSGAHSEVGARLGAALIARSMARDLGLADPRVIAERARECTLAHLEALAAAMSGEGRGSPGFLAAVGDHFLFTVVGFAITERRAFAFALGDGVLAVDGGTEVLGPYPENQPPYLGYALCPGHERASGFEIRPLPPPAEITSLLAGTDGASELDLSPFLADERVLRNSDMVRRLLWQQSKERALDDDATLVLVRRAQKGGSP